MVELPRGGRQRPLPRDPHRQRRRCHEHQAFQFRFQNNFTALTVTQTVGSSSVDIAPLQNGAVSVPHDPHLQVNETYTLTLVTGDRRKGTAAPIVNATTGSATFDKARRQHRREDDRRLPDLRRRPHLPDHDPRLRDGRQGVRRRAPGPVRGEPGRDLRHGRRTGRRDRHGQQLQRHAAGLAVLQERHGARTRGARDVPGRDVHEPGDRRLDDGLVAPDPRARSEPEASPRLPDP